MTLAVSIPRLNFKALPSGILAAISSRENQSGACIAGAIAMALLDKPIMSGPFLCYLAFLALGIRLGRIELRWTPEVVLALIIGASAIVATGASVFTGRNVPATGFLAAATILLIPLIFVKNVNQVFYALIPACYAQAILMTWQWFTGPMARATGFAHNANAGSALLLIGTIFLASHPRLKWLSVPLLVAIPFSGSRWVLVVGIIVLGLMFASKHVEWRYILIAVISSFAVLFAFQHEQVLAVYRMNNDAPVSTTESHIQYRLAPPVPINMGLIIPQGFLDSNLHNVPLRMTVETGLVSGLTWMAVGALALYRRPRYNYAWWMMLAICLLSIMYYHTWIGPMGVFWWLLVSQLMNNTLDAPQGPLRRFWAQISGIGRKVREVK